MMNTIANATAHVSDHLIMYTTETKKPIILIKNIDVDIGANLAGIHVRDCLEYK